MLLRSFLHGMASTLRKLPYIPGKLRLARVLNEAMTDHCGADLVRFQTKRGLSVRIDLRSKAEWRA